MPPPLEKISRYIPAIGKAISRGFYNPGSAQNLPPLSSLAQGSFSPHRKTDPLPIYTTKRKRVYGERKKPGQQSENAFSWGTKDRPEYNSSRPLEHFTPRELEVYDTYINSGGNLSEAARRLDVTTPTVLAIINRGPFDTYRREIDSRPYPMLITEKQQSMMNALIQSGGNPREAAAWSGENQGAIAQYVGSTGNSRKRLDEYMSLQPQEVQDNFWEKRQAYIDQHSGGYGIPRDSEQWNVRQPHRTKIKKEWIERFESTIKHGGDPYEIARDTNTDYSSVRNMLKTGRLGSSPRSTPHFFNWLKEQPQEVQDKFREDLKSLKAKHARGKERGEDGLTQKEREALTQLIEGKDPSPSRLNQLRRLPAAAEFLTDQGHPLSILRSNVLNRNEGRRKYRGNLLDAEKSVLDVLASTGRWPDIHGFAGDRRAALRKMPEAREYLESKGALASLMDADNFRRNPNSPKKK